MEDRLKNIENNLLELSKEIVQIELEIQTKETKGKKILSDRNKYYLKELQYHLIDARCNVNVILGKLK